MWTDPRDAHTVPALGLSDDLTIPLDSGIYPDAGQPLKTTLGDLADFIGGQDNPLISSTTEGEQLDLSEFQVVTVLRWIPTSLYAPALYRRVSSDPGTGAAFQDALGNWFENAEPTVTPEMFGALGQPSGYAGPNYDDPPWQIAINVQRQIKAMSPTYCFNAAPIVPSRGVLWVVSGLAGVQPTIYGTSSHSFAFGYVDFVHWVHLEGICMDGGRVRGTFPYSNNSPDPYTFVAFIDFHADLNDTTSQADIINCTFQNTHVYSWHLTMFNQVRDIANVYIRTADHGTIACNVVVVDGITKYFSSDNGVSISRGCLRVSITNSTFKDCELAGIWVAGFNTTGSGNLTITGTYTVLGTVAVVPSIAQFDQSLPGTFITVTGASADTCILKVISVQNSALLTAGVVTAVPADLQGVASTLWQNAPSLGVAEFTVSDNKVIGAYANGFDGVTAPRHGEVGNNVFRRTGCIADSQVVTAASIAVNSLTMTVASGDGTKFPTNSFIIVDPLTSYQNYFIAQVTNQTGDVLTLDRTSPRTYVSENTRLAHMNPTFGIVCNITGNSVGQHSFAENISFHDNECIDFVGIAVRLGNAGNGGTRQIEIKDNKFFQPAGIGNPSIDDPLLLMQEYNSPLTGTGALTITGTYTYMGHVAVANSVVLPFNASMVGQYLTVVGASADSCILKVLTITDTQHLQALVMNAVPADLQATPSTSWSIPQPYPSSNLFITGNRTDAITGFIKFLQRGPYPLPCVLFPNFTPNVSNYFTALDAANGNANISSDYAFGGLGRLQVDPTDPTGTSVTTAGGVYMGLAAQTTPTIVTPSTSGLFLVTVTGTVANGVIGDHTNISGRYNFVNLPPANGDLETSHGGVVFSTTQTLVTSTVAQQTPFCLSGIVGFGAPVPVGTPVWIDVVVSSPDGATSRVFGLQVSAQELYA